MEGVINKKAEQFPETDETRRNSEIINCQAQSQFSLMLKDNFFKR